MGAGAVNLRAEVSPYLLGAIRRVELRVTAEHCPSISKASFVASIDWIVFVGLRKKVECWVLRPNSFLRYEQALLWEQALVRESLQRS